MHLLALGAFWRVMSLDRGFSRVRVLMHLLALGAFWLTNSDNDYYDGKYES